jgi:hypothetical protein
VFAPSVLFSDLSDLDVLELIVKGFALLLFVFSLLKVLVADFVVTCREFHLLGNFKLVG